MVETQEIYSDLEEEIENNVLEVQPSVEQCYGGRDKITKWSKNSCPLRTPLEIWKHFFNNKLLRAFVKYTNIHIQITKTNYTRDRSTKKTDLVEIQALTGLLYLSGVLKSSCLNF